jgi:SAM-dependent methyltransferase
MARSTLAQFFDTSAGAQLHRWEAAQMDALMSTLSGDSALQIGAPYAKCLRSAPHAFKAVVSADASELALSHYDVNLLGDARALPFQECTFDLVVLMHALDLCENPTLVLNEAMRVLAPMGRLVILGFNPWGPWWYRRKEVLLGKDCPIHPVSVPWVKSTLGADCVIDRGRFGIYSPSLSENPNTLARWRWVEKAGDRWWPALANAYMLSGIKKVDKMTLVGKIAQKYQAMGEWVKAPAVAEGAHREVTKI